MKRYFFHIFNGTGPTRDEEGQELPSLEAARAEAVAGIRSLVADELEHGTIDLAGRIDICDRDGSVLASIPFTDVVHIRMPGEESR